MKAESDSSNSIYFNRWRVCVITRVVCHLFFCSHSSYFNKQKIPSFFDCFYSIHITNSTYLQRISNKIWWTELVIHLLYASCSRFYSNYIHVFTFKRNLCVSICRPFHSLAFPRICFWCCKYTGECSFIIKWVATLFSWIVHINGWEFSI